MGTLAASIAALTITVTLSGCFSLGAPRGGASISVNESGELLAGVCHDIPVHEIRISSKSDWNGDWIARVRGLGELDLRAGEYATIRKNSSDFSFETFEDVDVAPGSAIETYFYEEYGSSGVTAWGVFRIPEEGLKPGVWLFANGATSDRVCGVYEDHRG